MLQVVKVIALVLLVLLGLAAGVVLLPYIWMLGFGIVVPAIVIAVMPLRILLLVVFGTWKFRWSFLLLLLPWAHYLAKVLTHGFVTKSEFREGPTVNPYAWLGVAAMWFALEAIRRSTTRTAKDGAAQKLPPSS